MVNTAEKILQKRANSLAQSYRKAHGDEFEELVDVKLTRSGIPTLRRTIKTKDGSFISDHSYKHYWCESTTHMDKKRVDEFIKKRNLIQEVNNQITDFVLFYEKDFTTIPQKKLRKKLIDGGWKPFGGETEIDAYIEVMQRKDAFHKDKKLIVAKAKNLPLELLNKNPLNRDLIKKCVAILAKSMVEHGFVTGLFVVPMYNNYKEKKIIGYMLFEGHHRLAAVIYVRDYYGFTIPDIPCVVVDWISDKDHKELSNLLIKVNVEYKNWELKDFIKHHLEIAKILKDESKETSYQILENLRLESNRRGLGKGTLLYICGPLKGSSNFLDKSVIEDGVYEIKQDDYHNFMIPFINDIAEPFMEWFKSQDSYGIAVYRYFMSSLYLQFKKHNKLEKCKQYVTAFKMLGQDLPLKIELFTEDIWKKMDNEIKYIFG